MVGADHHPTVLGAPGLGDARRRQPRGAPLATLRHRRASIPRRARRSTRTAGHLLSVLATVPASVLVAAVVLLVGRTIGFSGTPDLAALAVGPLLVVGGGACGVLVATWLPFPVVAPAAIVVIFLLQVNLGHQSHRWRWLHFSAYNDAIAADPSTCSTTAGICCG